MVSVTSLRPSVPGARAVASWASPARIRTALLALMAATSVATLATFAGPDGVMLCPVWLALLLTFGIILERYQDQGRPVAAGQNAEADGRRLAVPESSLLPDAAHQLRTSVTIALGHAELLASELAGHRYEQDIYVVVGELVRLKRISERLLLIAASRDPGFLVLKPIALDSVAIEALRRWEPTAPRDWATGRLDAVTVPADRERLGQAMDALLENAVQHTGPGDTIMLSVARDDDTAVAQLIVEDSGEGITAAEIGHIFERFRTGPARDGHRGTGLGLPLVRAVARGHAGEVNVRSAPGSGSRFELVLPATSQGGPTGDAGAAARAAAAGGRTGRMRWPRRVRRPRPAVMVVAVVCTAVLAAVIAVDSATHRGAPTAEPAAPAFALPSLRNPAQLISLSAYRGRPVIVNFFASWCGPCERETPTLASFYRASAGRAVIIGVDADDSATAARHFVADDRVGYPIGFESTQAVADAYGVSGEGIPETFFLNASHHIVKRVLGDVTMAELTADTALINDQNRG